jgi:hypothetical protein
MAELMKVVDTILRMEYRKESVRVSIWQIDVWNNKYIIICVCSDFARKGFIISETLRSRKP